MSVTVTVTVTVIPTNFDVRHVPALNVEKQVKVEDRPFSHRLTHQLATRANIHAVDHNSRCPKLRDHNTIVDQTIIATFFF
jgi:hypothetical protein